MQVSRSLAMSTAPAAASTGQRTAMSFDVDARKHAVTVSVVDRNSGEVLQKMVYDKRVAVDPTRSGATGKAPRAGALVDVQA